MRNKRAPLLAPPESRLCRVLSGEKASRPSSAPSAVQPSSQGLRLGFWARDSGLKGLEAEYCRFGDGDSITFSDGDGVRALDKTSTLPPLEPAAVAGSETKMLLSSFSASSAT